MRFLLAALLVAGCAATPVPTPEDPRYSLNTQGNVDMTVLWVTTAPCAQPPKSWADIRAYCDLSKLESVEITPEQWARYKPGTAYP